MKRTVSIFLLFVILINCIFFAGCWNYREIDRLAIVAGVAIDEGESLNYQITAEIIEITGGRESKITSKLITVEGKTMFDAARNMIDISGKKLYWAHTKVLIISRKIAYEGISKILDWYDRDSETREDVNIIISERPTAKEIFSAEPVTAIIKSFDMDDMLKNEVSLGQAPIVDVLKYEIQLNTKGSSAVIPSVNLAKVNGKMTAQISGTAIVKNDKLVGFLGRKDSKIMLFIRNEIKAGVLNEFPKDEGKDISIALEMFGNKTKVKPYGEGKDIKMDINIDTIAAIDEIDGTYNFSDEGKLKKLEQNADNQLEGQILNLIQKVQTQYDADIFKFSAAIRGDDIKTWNNIQDDWDEVYKNIKVKVKVKVHIRNSAVLSKNLKGSD